MPAGGGFAAPLSPAAGALEPLMCGLPFAGAVAAFWRWRTTAPDGNAACFADAPAVAGTPPVFGSEAWALAGAASSRLGFFVISLVALFCLGRKKPRGCILRSERRTIFRSWETARSGIG